MNEALRESRLRSFLKALSWRMVATTTTILIAYFFTGNVHMAMKIGALEFILKILVYYWHERSWQLVPVGTIRRYSFFKKK